MINTDNLHLNLDSLPKDLPLSSINPLQGTKLASKPDQKTDTLESKLTALVVSALAFFGVSTSYFIYHGAAHSKVTSSLNQLFERVRLLESKQSFLESQQQALQDQQWDMTYLLAAFGIFSLAQLSYNIWNNGHQFKNVRPFVN